MIHSWLGSPQSPHIMPSLVSLTQNPPLLPVWQLATFSLFPHGKVLYRSRPICAWPESCLNIVWLPFGLFLGATQLALGLFYCMTIIGIPFGVMHLRMSHLFLWPFGAEVASAGNMPQVSSHTTVETIYEGLPDPNGGNYQAPASKADIDGSRVSYAV
mmetsp:Transcript_37844/g.106912  ORF Transcript_37844/g.106912 Transcript_37844/m.106912 type:complete len:158 (-) Transcript_37844:339-812(-)